MAERLVVADASPLIGLAAAGAFDLLRQLFGKVTVTTKVRDEVLAGGVLPGGRELAEAIRAGWIAVADADARDPTFAGLDPVTEVAAIICPLVCGGWPRTPAHPSTCDNSEHGLGPGPDSRRSTWQQWVVAKPPPPPPPPWC